MLTLSSKSAGALNGGTLKTRQYAISILNPDVDGIFGTEKVKNNELKISWWLVTLR